mgnify:CR=1 FL=1
MKRSNILPFEKILDWLEGKLPEEQAQSVVDLLAAADESTKADLEWLKTFLHTSKSVRLASLPAKVREVLSHRFAEYAKTHRPTGFMRYFATLTFDSRHQSALAGLRSASAESLQRQLIYSTEIAEVALNIQWSPQNQRLNLIGQIFPLVGISPAAFSVQLLQDSVEVGITVTDDLGEFNFKDIARGEYKLILCWADLEVLIPYVKIQP